MRLIADIFTRAELAGESGRWLVRADRVRPRELESRPAPAAHYPHCEPICVHFTGRGAEHSLWLPEAVKDESAETTTDGIALSWQRGPGEVLRGEVTLRGAVVCDVLAPVGARDRRALRSLGLTRAQAAVLAQSAGRPVLATFARGPALPPDMQRQVHRLLLASLARWSRLRRAS
jgi:hypothetical protein